MTILEKFGQMFVAIGVFVAIVAVVLLIAGRFGGFRGDRIVGRAFVAPALLLLAVGLIYPAVVTTWQSFKDANGTSFVGLENFKFIFTSSDELLTLRNTALWVLITPFVATFIGLVYAVLIDRARVEAFPRR